MTVSTADPLTLQQFWVRVAFSFSLLACALYIITSKRYSAAEKHWAYGLVGTLIGFWLKG